MRQSAFILMLAIIAGVGIWYWTASNDGVGGGTSITAAVDVVLPALTPTAKAGKSAFDANCAVCHGDNAAGTNQGPPLVHIIYEPSHHADPSFVLAVRNGVRAHHWPFGDMAPVPGVTDDEIVAIITYVRELQRHNGIR